MAFTWFSVIWPFSATVSDIFGKTLPLAIVEILSMSFIIDILQAFALFQLINYQIISMFNEYKFQKTKVTEPK